LLPFDKHCSNSLFCTGSQGGVLHAL
jgi:hypothetical protein